MNASYDILTNSTSDNAILLYSFIIPEYVNLVVILLSIYGMHQGIEIQHPLYAVLFLNLNLALASTVLNIIGFTFAPIQKFVMISNLFNSQSLYFHCTSWCVTSVIRYVYIFHEDALHKLIPGSKSKCLVAIVTSLAYSALQSAPVFVIIVHFGQLFTTFLRFSDFLTGILLSQCDQME